MLFLFPGKAKSKNGSFKNKDPLIVPNLIKLKEKRKRPPLLVNLEIYRHTKKKCLNGRKEKSLLKTNN